MVSASFVAAESPAPIRTALGLGLEANGKVVGTIRIKPSGVLWKPKGKGKYFRKSLEDFAAWITDPKTKASQVKQ